MHITWLAIPLLLSGCIISGGDTEPCENTRVEEAPSQIIEYRNPESGACQDFGGGGGGGGETCGNWGGNNDQADPIEPGGAFLDWASCESQCEGLSEQNCLTTSACRVAYAIGLTGDQEFYECWGTAPSGPIQGGGCEGLDAYTCSQHDDCSPVHYLMEAFGGEGGFAISLGQFDHCIDEPGSNPDPGECVGQIACDSLAPECPLNTVPGILDGCWSGYCIPQDQCQGLATCDTLPEDQCVARTDCDGLYQGVDCTCVGESCTCASWDFEGCEEGAP